MMSKLKEAVQVVREKISDLLPMGFDEAVSIYESCLRGKETDVRTLCRALSALLRDVGVCSETLYLVGRLHKACSQEFIRSHVAKMRERDPHSAVAEAFDVVLRGGNR